MYLAASLSANNALNSANSASSSSLAASLSANNALNSALIAVSSANTSLFQANIAIYSANSALNSALSANNSFTNFDKRYIGSKPSDPILDNEGLALAIGAIYYNTVMLETRVFNGSAWTTAYVPSGISSVGANSPIHSTGGTSPVISIPAANNTQDGYLTSSDWTTFNSKQTALGFTPASNTLTINGHSLTSNVNILLSDVGISSWSGSANVVSVGNITSGTWSGNFGNVSGANLTSLTANNLTGTIPSTVLGSSNVYIGTSQVALNRTSGVITLSGVSIDGNANTVTTNANLSGEVTSIGNSTTISNSSVIGKVLTGYTSGAGIVASTDTILTAIQKLNGNIAGITIPSAGNNSISLGTAVNNGSSASFLRSDATIPMFDTTSPSTQAFGDNAVIGSVATAARRDHKHAMPAAPTLSGLGGLATTGGIMTGAIASLQETAISISSSNIDCSLGNDFYITISGTTTLTVSNVPATGTSFTFYLELTNGGSATVSLFSGVQWASGLAPTLTTSGTDLLAFRTRDGGTTWLGVYKLDMK